MIFNLVIDLFNLIRVNLREWNHSRKRKPVRRYGRQERAYRSRRV